MEDHGRRHPSRDMTSRWRWRKDSEKYVEKIIRIKTVPPKVFHGAQVSNSCHTTKLCLAVSVLWTQFVNTLSVPCLLRTLLYTDASVRLDYNLVKIKRITVSAINRPNLDRLKFWFHGLLTRLQWTRGRWSWELESLFTIDGFGWV